MASQNQFFDLFPLGRAPKVDGNSVPARPRLPVRHSAAHSAFLNARQIFVELSDGVFFGTRNSVIRKVLHPFCNLQAPRVLDEFAETGVALFGWVAAFGQGFAKCASPALHPRDVLAVVNCVRIKIVPCFGFHHPLCGKQRKKGRESLLKTLSNQQWDTLPRVLWLHERCLFKPAACRCRTRPQDVWQRADSISDMG